MKKLLLIIVPFLLCACAPRAVRIALPGVDKSTSVPVQDLRPSNEKESTTFSYLITSNAYGIFREGDETLDPPMTQVFRRLVYENLDGPGKSLKISIYHMVVYMNMQSEIRKSALGGALLGGIGAGIAGAIAMKESVNLSQSLVDRKQFESASNKEYERAFYTDTENPNHAPLFVIYIDAAINGKRVFVKTMAPTTAPKGKNAYAEAVKSAIQYFLSQY